VLTGLPIYSISDSLPAVSGAVAGAFCMWKLMKHSSKIIVDKVNRGV
jgi:hypothetical protein